MYFRCAVSQLKVSLGGISFGIDSQGNYGYYKYDETAGADTLVPFSSKTNLAFTSIASARASSGKFPSFVELGLLVCCTATTRTESSSVSLTLKNVEYYDLGNLSLYGTYDTAKCTAGTRVFLVKNVPEGTSFSFTSGYAYAYGYRIIEIK